MKRGKVFGEEEGQVVSDVMRSGVVSKAGSGPMVQRFEREFAGFHGMPFAIATTSGTTALHIAVSALEIGPGDEVIVPDLTFISTASVVLQNGAKVVLCDIDERTLTISTGDLLRKVNSRTKAVMVVHLYGRPANMQEILEITKPRGIAVVEDCAQAHGATIGGQKVGTFGDLGCFSFYQTKNMSCGEGGMVITNNETLARRCKSLTRHGLVGDDLSAYDYDKLGFNYSMTELQAAIGLVQLAKLDRLNQVRRRNAKLYRLHLSGLPMIRFQEDCSGHVNYCLTAVLRGNLAGERDRFLEAVRAEGILVNCLYPKALSGTKLCSGAEDRPATSGAVASSVFNLYTNPDITAHFVETCCAAIRKVCLASQEVSG
ncbi:MAG: DegT/DnrJ/EryC1/StrS family aminotransferase [Candidatus Kerfeldbacteria bacterium]|nr:DegT/DnrJ/EryC1/StrS family aminotransferase [Candidatus Kerfeldbacteria bacterium]